MHTPEPKAQLVAAEALAHLDALYAFALRLTRDAHVAEDLVQDTFSRCMTGAHGFVPGTHLKAWLFRILRNAFLDLRRREGHNPIRAVAEPPDSAPLPGPADVDLDQLRHLVAQDIDAALQAISEDQRSVVLLDFEGLSEQEIADVMGCAPGTVKSRLARARAALRERLREYAK